MAERAWSLSAESKGRGDLQGLQEAIVKLGDEEEELLVHSVQNPSRMLYDGEGTIAEVFTADLYESGLVEKLSHRERA